MKNRKFLGVFSFLLSVCLLFATLPFVSANAEEGTGSATETVVKVYEAESYKISVFGFNGDITVEDTEKDDKNLVNAANFSVKKNGETVNVYTDGTILKDSTLRCWVKVPDNPDKKITEIKFDTLTDAEKERGYAEYIVTATVAVKKDGGQTEKSEKVVKVQVYAENPYGDEILKENVAPEVTVETVTETKKAIFKKEEIWKIINGTDKIIGDVDHLSAKIYLRTPGGTWPSSATTTISGSETKKEHTVSARGDYHFYVLFTDHKGNTTEKDSELVEKSDGFYKVNDETNEETKVIPIFSFGYKPDETVKVTCSNNKKTYKGFVNQIQNSITYTLENATDKDVEFVLMFKAEGATKYEVAKNGVDAKFDESKFTKSSLEFTPLKRGDYSFQVNATEGVEQKIAIDAGVADNIVVHVDDNVTIIKRENTAFTDFVKNNWKALIFLGIAVLCLIAIIVIACWKPKDKTAVKRQIEDAADKDDKKSAKVSETKNAEDEATEAADLTEETVEAKKENAEDTTEVAPETEVTDETNVEGESETPVENAEEVASENPAENAETPAESSEAPVKAPAENESGDKAE